MDPATFLTELKRHRVYRVAVAYAIVAWLLIQAFGLPAALPRALVRNWSSLFLNRMLNVVSDP
jgi:hypothetical protein